jgi:hypothetical protein
LFVGREGADVGDYGSDQGVRRVVAVAAQGFYQAVFAEFFVTEVHGFGDAIGIKRQQIAATQRGFADCALPSFEDAENGGSGLQAIE